MTKLEELIKELCPNGVEYATVGKICNISRGIVLSKDFIRENAGNYPVYSSQTENNGCLGFVNFYKYDGEYVTWTTDGANAGTIFYRTGKFNITNVCGLLEIVDSSMLVKFLYYVLSIESMKHVNAGMGNPKLMSNVMASIKIPLPPLAVQREIVQILDKFTLLSAELTAELTARRKQYEFYRDKLLDFNFTMIKVMWKSLGELGDFYGGLNGKTKSDFTNGNAKLITYKNVYLNSALRLDVEDTVIIEPNEKQNTLQYGDIIFTGSSETPEECGFSSVVTKETNEKLYLNSFCFFLRLHDSKILLPEFSKYLFRSNNLRIQICKTASGVTRYNVSKDKMKKVVIPVPPIDVQERIVKVLDNFDAICSDLEMGLPAEIEARQKQYEFYRDKLLKF